MQGRGSGLSGAAISLSARRGLTGTTMSSRAAPPPPPARGCEEPGLSRQRASAWTSGVDTWIDYQSPRVRGR